MDRSSLSSRRSRAARVVALAILVPLAGCNVVATGMYFLHGMNVPAECSALVGKRVAVVCRTGTSLQYNNPNVSRDLAKQVSLLLGKNVRRVHMIDQKKVLEWADENTWEDFVEIGRHLDAEIVVGIDLEDFSLFLGQTLYQGRANLDFAVYDVAKGKEPIDEHPLPQVIYPPNTPIPTTDKSEQQFRAAFIRELASQIAEYFYEHDPTATFANDSTALTN